jgi:hypothetical protein
VAGIVLASIPSVLAVGINVPLPAPSGLFFSGNNGWLVNQPVRPETIAGGPAFITSNV